MRTVSSLFLGIGFACVLAGIVHLLSPGGMSERVLRLMTTLFILVSILSPLREISGGLSIKNVPEIQTDSAVKIVLENAKKAIENSARSVTEKYGFPNAKIYVETENRNGEVHTGTFRIIGVDEEKGQEIADEIFALTGEKPVMEIGEKSGDSG